MQYENDNVRKVYDEIADHFDGTRTYTWQWIADIITSLPKQSLIYDIGCGNGRNMSIPNYNFIGVDNCDKFVNMCLKKKLNVVQSDMCCLPFKSDSADAVMSIASFHHLYTEERREKALLEMKRVVKPNGIILLSVWSIEQPKKTRRTFDKHGDTIVKWDKYGEIHERYYYIFDLKEILELFDKCGLHMIQTTWECGNEVFILKPK